MKRRLFTILSALSLLLFVAVVVLWVRSYWVTDRVWRLDYAANYRDMRNRAFISWRGVVAYTEERQRVPLWVSPPTFERWQHRAEASPTHFHALMGRPTFWGARGFAFRTRELPSLRAAGAPWVPWLVVALPYWLVVVPFAFLPGVWIASQMRRRRLCRGLCPSCGYDLRATPGRCPECGVATERSKKGATS